jgi:hypothetical protein
MGRFYLPKDTMGELNTAKREMIVYAGRVSYIGFEGSVAEINALEFSFSDDPITEVYSVNAMRRETLLPTSMPAHFTVSALNSSGKDMAQPLQVHVALDRFAPSPLPEGQMDVTACWMAGICWASIGLQRRPTFWQEDIMNLSAGKNMWLGDGSINIMSLNRLLAKELSNLYFKTELIKPADLWNYVNLYPVIIGYQETLMGHINVIYGNDGAGNLYVMDPWWPEPTNYGFTVESGGGGYYLFNSTPGASQEFHFLGTKTQRPMSYYSDRPLQSGMLWVGYPKTIE